jgi:hypothetical protein
MYQFLHVLSLLLTPPLFAILQRMQSHVFGKREGTPFEINVTVLGCNDNVKASVLNGLFGEVYLLASREAAVYMGVADFFHIVRDGPVDKKIVDIHSVETNNNTIKDRILPSTNIDLEKHKYVIKNDFNVLSSHDLTRILRDDTAFAFIDIPCFNSRPTRSVGESFFLENLVHFDRAIVVVDPFEDVEDAGLPAVGLDCN